MQKITQSTWLKKIKQANAKKLCKAHGAQKTTFLPHYPLFHKSHYKIVSGIKLATVTVLG